MNWEPVDLGKWRGKGKTLPAIVFADPDWFLWAYEQGVLAQRRVPRFQEVYRKARSIRILQAGPRRLVSEYVVHPPTGGFSHVDLVDPSITDDVGSSPSWSLRVLDL